MVGRPECISTDVFQHPTVRYYVRPDVPVDYGLSVNERRSLNILQTERGIVIASGFR
jgi:hypothetical protein